MSDVTLFDRAPLYDWLTLNGCSAWAAGLKELCGSRFSEDYQGLYPRWRAAWEQLPPQDGLTFDAASSAVSVDGDSAVANADLKQALMEFHPWRKGPFKLFDFFIDTEWRSDWKWDRIAPHLDFRGKKVLDVGCGNGYYGWRMLSAGASFVLGCEPLLLYNFQFEVLRKYARPADRHFVVPIADIELPSDCKVFDLVFSMGVLYHRTSPIDHLRVLKDMLVPSGQLVLETLVLPDESPTILTPKDRYCQMRNVWFIPSISMLVIWLGRCGFKNIKVLDVSRTTTLEQRKTDWMTYESLESFLDPQDHNCTIEGYPGPLRATLIAEKPS